MSKSDNWFSRLIGKSTIELDNIKQSDVDITGNITQKQGNYVDGKVKDSNVAARDINQNITNIYASQLDSEYPEIKPENINEYLTSWFQLLSDECAHLPLEILNARQGLEHSDKIELPDIFVPLKAKVPSKQWLETREHNLVLAREIAEGEKNEPEPIMECLKTQRLSVVIGDPGSGKSALVNQLTWMLLQKYTNNQNSGEFSPRIPLRIILRSINIPKEATKGQASWIWDAVEKDIGEKLEKHLQARKYAKAVLSLLQQKLMHEPFGLIMLDGLDEVPAANERRSLLLQAIQALVSALPDSFFIITARPYAYTDPRWRLKDFTAFVLTPFDEEQRAQFINGWYNAASSRFNLKNAELQQRIPDLIARVEGRDHLREMAQRPLLLTLISTLHASGGRLPEDRAQLYKDSVDLLLYHWRREAFREVDGLPLQIDDSQLKQCLQKLAFKSHQSQREQQDSRHTADISHMTIVEVFSPLLDTLGKNDLLGFLHQHTGILIARGENSFAFPHRSFQEYLAMGYLTAQDEDVLSPEVCTDPLWWREVFLLAVLEQKQKPRNACRSIQELLEYEINKSDETQNRLYILSALALSELGIKAPEKLAKELSEGLKNILKNSDVLNVSERAEAGRGLAAIGDNRRGVGVTDKGLPDIHWKKIPAGTIILDDNKGEFPVKAFYLATYPVTNAQFQCFINDNGYSEPRWWVGLDTKVDEPGIAGWQESNHPRERVSWYEAMAYCVWLSERLGFEITLPTEWQWQQAACSGKTDFDFPWGTKYKPDYANISDTENTLNLERTSAVGLYPQGNSAQGVADLSGNVWEWCLNEYKNPKKIQVSGTLGRVVRGGSWLNDQNYARASCRYDFDPGLRFNYVGFRVCCLSPIMITGHGDTVL